MANNINVATLTDNELAEYTSRLNLQYILLVNSMGNTVEGSKQYGNAVVDLRMCECQYKAAVKEAISRGVVLTS